MNSIIGMTEYAKSKEAKKDLVQIAPAVKYRPSRFNAHTTAADGAVILYNTYTGRNCAIPPKHAALAGRYLSVVGTSGPLDKLGTYLLENGYILEESVDE